VEFEASNAKEEQRNTCDVDIKFRKNTGSCSIPEARMPFRIPALK
jgi:hypothetical protein